jgi:hypothetical protein
MMCKSTGTIIPQARALHEAVVRNFNSLDTDSSGTISWNEMRAACKDQKYSFSDLEKFEWARDRVFGQRQQPDGTPKINDPEYESVHKLTLLLGGNRLSRSSLDGYLAQIESDYRKGLPWTMAAELSNKLPGTK